MSNGFEASGNFQDGAPSLSNGKTPICYSYCLHIAGDVKKRRKIEGVQMCQHQYCHPNNLTIPGKRTDVTRIILRHGRGSTPWSLGTLAWHSRLLARLLFYSSFKFFSCLSLCSLCPTGPELSVMSHSLCAFPMPVP